MMCGLSVYTLRCALSLVSLVFSLVFWKVFSVEVHPFMTSCCTFWQSAFSVSCFGAFMCVVDGVGMEHV